MLSQVAFTVIQCVLTTVLTDQEAHLGPLVISVKEAALLKFS